MSMMKLAFQNFKHNFANYVSLIISLSFTILILYNFQNLIDSHILDPLGGSVLQNVEVVIEIITVVLFCFMVFFVWYATNIFLAKRKKEIGVYIFMGLTNQKIGKLYLIETLMTGMTALLIGTFSGILTSQLFQMILGKLSDISLDLQLGFSFTAFLQVSALYLIIYTIFSIKGYVNIVRSSVLEMVSATRQNETVKQHQGWLLLKAISGIVILCVGYYLAIKKGEFEVLSNSLLAVIFVIIGMYLIFGGFLPLIVQSLSKNKRFLYQKERTVWINTLVFRIKKNYRTYAMLSVLMLCSITALSAGFGMKEKHDAIVHFRNTYTYQVLSTEEGLYEEFYTLIDKTNDIKLGGYVPFLQLDASKVESRYANASVAVLSYSQTKQLANDAGFLFPFEEPTNQEYIHINKKTLISLLTDTTKQTVKINDQEYQSSDHTTTPYLGYLQEKISFYLVNDMVYASLLSSGQQFYVYNYSILDSANFNASTDDLQSHPACVGLVKTDPNSDEFQWVRILYSLCIFMFMVFVLASGSIIYMKVYNDAFEEKQRYSILRNIGISQRTARKAIINELRFAYFAPLSLMAISSYFSVKAIGNTMQVDLLTINIFSLGIVSFLFYLCYRMSIIIYQKNIALKE